MSYELQALIGPAELVAVAAAEVPAARPRPLAQGLALIPATPEFLAAFRGGDGTPSGPGPRPPRRLRARSARPRSTGSRTVSNADSPPGPRPRRSPASRPTTSAAPAPSAPPSGPTAGSTSARSPAASSNPSRPRAARSPRSCGGSAPGWGRVAATATSSTRSGSASTGPRPPGSPAADARSAGRPPAHRALSRPPRVVACRRVSCTVRRTRGGWANGAAPRCESGTTPDLRIRPAARSVPRGKHPPCAPPGWPPR